MNIPNAIHLGYVIANSDEEFLATFRYRPGYTLKAWTLTPVHAHIFQSRQMAKNTIRLLDHYQKLWILELFDTPNQLILASESRDRPHWLHASA